MHSQQATVEQVVRAELAKALGGRRGIAEAALPTITFTVLWIVSHNLRLALLCGVTVAVLALVLRIVQRQSTQFVFNAVVGIAIAALFALRSGEARDAFLPGILYNGGYAAVLVFTILVGWPLVGFLVGAATNEPTAWHGDKAMVKLCSRLTWMLALPCVVRVIVQYPLWAADKVALLGTAKIVMGWPLQVAALGGMVWLLSRNSIPINEP